MNTHCEIRAIGTLAVLGGALLLGLGSPACAKSLADTESAWEAAFRSSGKPEFMQIHGLSIGGRLEGGISTSISPERLDGTMRLNDHDVESRSGQIHLYEQREAGQPGLFLGFRRAF
ncbi:MAG: hypothetical protein H6R26_2639 [Proteobacteria bacterium]|nr:hypothetical protein [Pseudomonadota bacterium]